MVICCNFLLDISLEYLTATFVVSAAAAAAATFDLFRVNLLQGLD